MGNKASTETFDPSSECILLMERSPVAEAWPCIRPIPSLHYCLMRAEASLQGSGGALIAAVWWRGGLPKSAVAHCLPSTPLTHSARTNWPHLQQHLPSARTVVQNTKRRRQKRCCRWIRFARVACGGMKEKFSRAAVTQTPFFFLITA